MWALRYTSRTRVTHELLFGVHVLHGEQSGNRLTSLGNVVCKFRSKHHIPSTPLGIATTSSKAYHPYIAVGYVMGASMATGIASSMTVETVLLHFGRDKLGWLQALKTAAGMSMISMASMEAVQNVVDYHLTGGVVSLSDPYFWGAALVSMAAGFLAPLPYNYIRLRRYGKACH
ncbi:conserved hypothetical protein [Histoplasma capsulatum var. duboisii H88]|uniref:DUF4396 domain-containing protein n=1 Tax=Ajellomyces capsulatus (strain H88) TaxID=544711 RepID=F0UQJ7_AJEC8|nr:conserved hypothetical protein [Histoplasma capsulatum var. duboisii H88]